jgi:hypothetical protein
MSLDSISILHNKTYKNRLKNHAKVLLFCHIAKFKTVFFSPPTLKFFVIS